MSIHPRPKNVSGPGTESCLPRGNGLLRDHRPNGLNSRNSSSHLSYPRRFLHRSRRPWNRRSLIRTKGSLLQSTRMRLRVRPTRGSKGSPKAALLPPRPVVTGLGIKGKTLNPLRRNHSCRHPQDRLNDRSPRLRSHLRYPRPILALQGRNNIHPFQISIVSRSLNRVLHCLWSGSDHRFIHRSRISWSPGSILL